MFPVIENHRGSMPELNAEFRKTQNPSPLFFQKRNDNKIRSNKNSKLSKNLDLNEVYIQKKGNPYKNL
jgi:hypothetical protein